jgi:hypothetical protein
VAFSSATRSTNRANPNKANALVTNAVAIQTAADAAGSKPTGPIRSASSTTKSVADTGQDTRGGRVSNTRPANRPETPGTQPLPNSRKGR